MFSLTRNIVVVNDIVVLNVGSSNYTRKWLHILSLVKDF